uniref:ATP synthase F0 subunit 8 n=1 Tax=Cobitis sinensis TaxID=143401 RepID=Q49SI5_COBSI|nr:ATP synthase F0 subunit 8 [Cobitis sinensis]AAS48069.1 ATP synthase F0 subunit 8 [Cobitis sinensis]
MPQLNPRPLICNLIIFVVNLLNHYSHQSSKLRLTKWANPIKYEEHKAQPWDWPWQ